MGKNIVLDSMGENTFWINKSLNQQNDRLKVVSEKYLWEVKKFLWSDKIPSDTWKKIDLNSWKFERKNLETANLFL